MSKIKNQISTLARICRVGPYSQDHIYQLPISSDLLSLLYQEILNVTDKDLAMILYSVFYPCCQIYFHRFLHQWLFEGTLVDPFEEFCIKTDTRYSNYRNRTYWMKHFSFKQNTLPEFLLDLKSNLLLCGKTMNLLKLCKPEVSTANYSITINVTNFRKMFFVIYVYIYIFQTPLGKHVIDQSPFVTCCLTPDQLTKAKQYISTYYVEAASVCGPRINVTQKFRERENQHLLFLSKVQEKQAITLKRIECKYDVCL